MSIAVVIHGCDKYKWIFPEFLSFFSVNFPEVDWPIYFCTEELSVSLPDRMTLVRAGFGEWSTRLKRILNYIPDDNILYLQEDYFVLRTIKDTLLQIGKIHETSELNITKLATNYEFSVRPVMKNNEEMARIDGFPLYYQPNGLYTMSHQPVAFFNKQFLLDTLNIVGLKHPEGFGPSTHEIVMSEVIAQKCVDPKIYCVGNIYNPNKSDIVQIHHAITRGVYNPL
jgi:hypothetical protein